MQSERAWKALPALGKKEKCDGHTGIARIRGGEKFLKF